MENKGKLVVLEGIDGSGKTTQYNMLLKKLNESGIRCSGTSFPNYESVSGKLVSSYLAGDLGHDPKSVNPYAASSIYAVDRFTSFRTDSWGNEYRLGGNILSARYTTSNAIHQASKIPVSEQTSFFQWLTDYEYGLLDLPKPDEVFLLKIPVEIALKQIESRQTITGISKDIHELDSNYICSCAELADKAALYYGWKIINVCEGSNMRTPESIFEELYFKISSIFLRK